MKKICHLILISLLISSNFYTLKCQKPRRRKILPKKYKIIPPRRYHQEGDTLHASKLTEIKLDSKNLSLFFGGKLKDEFFVYNRVHTLRTDLGDQNDFFRHKLNLNLLINHGKRKPTSQAFVRLTNYVYWQDESHYLPLTIEEIRSPNFDNIKLAEDVKVKSLVPLLFAEQAWFKLNFDTFFKSFKDHPSHLKIGYFPYIVGRGVALGYHEDLAVEYLGWKGEGGFTRYPAMPPGILFHSELNKNWSFDLYFNQWRETNASLSDTMAPIREPRLDGPRPGRSSGKDRFSWVARMDYKKHGTSFGDIHAQPYFIYVKAPEQTIEIKGDASAKLYTNGVMLNVHYKNFDVNVEVAGQFGHQKVHALDRNQIVVTRSGGGNVQEQFSHVFALNTTGQDSAPVARRNADIAPASVAGSYVFDPYNRSAYLVNTPENRNLEKQGQELRGITLNSTGNPTIHNSDFFGNKRFRNPYKLKSMGFMALLDVSYDFEKHPFKLAGAAGYISGDNYPYNEESSRTYNGFIPLRSRYKGLGVQNILIFDRLTIPRPLNISHRTLYAFNNKKDLNNLQFFGLGLTWYPSKNRRKFAITGDIMWLWEVARLKKWDKNGTHPESAIEAQLIQARNTLNPGTPQSVPTKFSGWESNKYASQMLGTEIDIKANYQVVNHCDFMVKFALFFPGKLYKDLDGQPNEATIRNDNLGYTRYESLGHSAALAFICGLNYKF